MGCPQSRPGAARLHAEQLKELRAAYSRADRLEAPTPARPLEALREMLAKEGAGEQRSLSRKFVAASHRGIIK